MKIKTYIAIRLLTSRTLCPLFPKGNSAYERKAKQQCKFLSSQTGKIANEISTLMKALTHRTPNSIAWVKNRIPRTPAYKNARC